MRKIMAALLLEVAFALNAAAPVSAESATANDTARFLAGLPPAPNSPLAVLTHDPLWQNHARHSIQFLRAKTATPFPGYAHFPRNIYLTGVKLCCTFSADRTSCSRLRFFPRRRHTFWQVLNRSVAFHN